MRFYRLVTTLLVTLLVLVPLGASAAPPAQGGNLLKNAGFEEGFSERGAGEVTVANGWEPWWVQGSKEQTDAGYLKRPEYKGEDAWNFTMRRVHSGGFCQKYFNTYSTHIAGMYQQVAVTKGSKVTVFIWDPGWSSSESDEHQFDGFGNSAAAAGIASGPPPISQPSSPPKSPPRSPASPPRPAAPSAAAASATCCRDASCFRS